MGNNNKLLPIAKDCGGELPFIAIKGEYYYISTQKTHCQARNKHFFYICVCKMRAKGMEQEGFTRHLPQTWHLTGQRTPPTHFRGQPILLQIRRLPQRPSPPAVPGEETYCSCLTPRMESCIVTLLDGKATPPPTGEIKWQRSTTQLILCPATASCNV